MYAWKSSWYRVSISVCESRASRRNVPRHVEREGSIQHHAMLERMILGRKGLQIVKLKADKLDRDCSQKLGGQPQPLGFSRDLFPDMPRRIRGCPAPEDRKRREADEKRYKGTHDRIHRDLNNRGLDSGPSRPDLLLRPRPAAQTSPERYGRGIEWASTTTYRCSYRRR